MAETPQMAARATAPSRLLVFGVEILLPASPLLPAHALRLLDGSGWVQLGDGRQFFGADGDYGSLRGVGAVEDALGDQAPSCALTLAPLTDACLQQIGQPVSQGAPVQVLYGEIDRTTGRFISDPEAIFYGALDVGHVKVDRNARTIGVDLVSHWEGLFATNDGAGLNSAWHNQFEPGELGFAFADTVQHAAPWGAKGPRPDQATGARNYDVDRGGGRTSLRF